MARREGDDNLLLFQDHLSDSALGVYYRMPTTKERIAYRIEQIQKKNGKEANPTGIRIKHGLKILVGTRGDDFQLKGPDGEYIALTNKTENWKDHFERIASDVAEYLAIRVFELSLSAAVKEDEPLDPEEEGETPDQD